MNLIYSESYDYNTKGFIEVKTVVDGSETDIFNYTYDKIGQLTEVKKNNSTIETYSYDSNGNRLNNNAQYDSQDRLISNSSTTFGYTERGTLLTRTENNQITSYNYDLMGNLLSVTLPNSTEIEYITDARNRRIAKKVNGIVTQKFLYLNQLEAIAELDANDNIISLFIYGTRSNTPDYIIKNNIKYKVVTNQLGSVVKVVNVSTGEIIQAIEYDSYGNILSDSNPNFQPFRLAGGLYDNDTKLTRFGARDYDARDGRWTTKDPIKFDGGMNFYVYAGNNPVNYVDLDGRDAVRGADLFLYQLEKNSTIIDNYAMKLMEYYSCKGIEEDREFFGYQDGLNLNNDLLNVKFGDIGSKDMSVNRKKEANSKFYIHGHGKARWLLDGEFFSNNDINAAALNQINGYLITPSGRILKWELSTGETSEIGKFDITQCNCPKDFPYNIILGEK